IKGSISDATGKSLYLSHMGINSSAIVDSVKIKGDGLFEFKQPQPDSYDFYRLQLGKNSKAITVAIDSNETVTLTINGKEFTDSYVAEGSEETRKIQEINQLRTALEKQITLYIKNSGPATADTKVAIYNTVKEFKENIFKQYIAPAPDKASAYYALFLQANGISIFNPNANRFDSKCFSAVATSLSNRYPGSVRAKNIYSIAAKGMQSTRPVQTDTIDAKESTLTATGLFDIKLPNIKGDSVSLSSLKGKIVLLDFVAYGDTRTSAHTIALRELYKKYKEQGFEIFQVSFDDNEHFWKTSADNLPWICVRDAAGAASSNILLYRIDKIPSYFLINKENEIVLRDEQITNLSAEIEKLMK
ncbi:MAG: redoxin domain-containing protein, partial [Bacteroidaceae bacterium]|nr:redoxin domain-containing protein [Bacteroidaceae bacterium]